MGFFRQDLTDEAVKTELEKLFTQSVEVTEHLNNFNPEACLPVEEDEKKAELLKFVREAEKLADKLADATRSLRKTIKPY